MSVFDRFLFTRGVSCKVFTLKGWGEGVKYIQVSYVNLKIYAARQCRYYFLLRSSDSAKCGAGASLAPVSRAWVCGEVGVGVWRRPPAVPRRVTGSQRSLVSVASDSAATRRTRHAPVHPHPAHSGFSLFVSGLRFLT